MTIIFESRQINDKCLIIQFQFDSYDVKDNESHSLDKYIGLDLWSQIYTKLNAPLERYKTNIDAQLKGEIISMHRAQLELKLTWRNKQPFHREVMNQEKKNCDLCPFVLIVSISAISLVNKFKKQLSQEKLITEKSQSKSTHERKAASQESSDCNGIHTPNSVDSKVSDEEYVPPGITVPFVNYTPSSTGVKKVDEYTPPNSIQSDNKRSKNKKTKKDEDARKLKKLRKEWELLDEKNVFIEQILNLHNMTFDEIADTLPQNEKSLRKRIRENINIPDHLIKKIASEYWNYLLILDALVTSDQQTYMYKQLVQMFFKDKSDAGSTNHENLLWCFLVPQWALQMFMHEFVLTKDAAMQRLLDQDQASIQNNSILD